MNLSGPGRPNFITPGHQDPAFFPRHNPIRAPGDTADRNRFKILACHREIEKILRRQRRSPGAFPQGNLEPSKAVKGPVDNLGADQTIGTKKVEIEVVALALVNRDP